MMVRTQKNSIPNSHQFENFVSTKRDKKTRLIIRTLIIILSISVYFISKHVFSQLEVKYRKPVVLTFSLPIPDDLMAKYQLSQKDIQIDKVIIAGGFSNWDPEDDHYKMKKISEDQWQITLLLSPGRNPYKYVVFLKGHPGKHFWFEDDNATVFEDDAFGGLNSVYIIKTTRTFRKILNFILICVISGIALLVIFENLIPFILRLTLSLKYKLMIVFIFLLVISNVFFILYTHTQKIEFATKVHMDELNIIHNQLTGSGVDFSRLDDSKNVTLLQKELNDIFKYSQLRQNYNLYGNSKMQISMIEVLNTNGYIIAHGMEKTISNYMSSQLGQYYNENDPSRMYHLYMEFRSNAMKEIFKEYRRDSTKNERNIFAFFRDYLLTEEQTAKLKQDSRYISTVRFFPFNTFIAPIYSYSQLTGYYYLGINPESLSILFRSYFYFNIILVIILLLLYLIFLNQTGDLILNPLYKLIDWTEALGKGDFSLKKTTQTNDEISLLFKNFGKMSQSLKANIDNTHLLNIMMSVLHNHLEIDMLYQILLRFITSHPGFPLNRAFVLLRDEDRLRGKYASGYINAQEILDNHHSLPLFHDKVKNAENILSIQDSEFEAIETDFSRYVQQIELSSDTSSLFWSALQQEGIRPYDVETITKSEQENEIFSSLNMKSFLITPISHNNKVSALIIMDNVLSDLEPDQSLIEQLQIILHQFESTLDRAFLYENLEMMVKLRTKEVQERTRKLDEANKKLMRLDGLKNEFIANISHDFRSPLTVIMNMSELAGMKCEDDTVMKKDLDVIYKASNRLKNSIDRLLDIARMDAQGVKLNIAPIDLNIFIKNIIGYYKSALLNSGIEITTLLPDSLPEDFYSDGEKLEEVIDNILSNAVKFIDHESGRIKLILEVQNTEIVIRIQDNGIGIPSDKLDLIFNRFEQVHDSKSSPYKGTGIGLAFSKQLIGFLQGNIHAESEGKNQGTTFVIQLPLGKEIFSSEEVSEIPYVITHDTGKSPTLLPGISGVNNSDTITKLIIQRNEEYEYDYTKAVILIVEDDENIRNIVMSYLKNSGYINFILTSDGKQALDAIYSSTPDIIISDINMPNMRGDELQDELLENNRFNRIPMIFLSAIIDQKIINERREKGACAYLQKPIDQKNLLLTVKQFLESYYQYLQIFDMATIDQLSGLYNKRELMNRFEQELSTRTLKDISVMFFDIDDFKNINDKYGHKCGDMVITQVGSILKQTLRISDICGRYGGDEFMVILPETSVSNSRIAAQSLQTAIKNSRILYQEINIDITLSIGITSLFACSEYILQKLGIENLNELYPVNTDDSTDWSKISSLKKNMIDLLLTMADQAMYQAKKMTCHDCNYQMIFKKQEEPGHCPHCGSSNILKGKNRIEIFSCKD